MGTLTFFLHGTRYHEEGNIKTVVSALSESCSGNSYVISGPGGKSSRKGAPALIPGTYKVDPDTNTKVPLRRMAPTKVTALVAAATGWGVDQNLVEMLIKVESAKPLPTTINLMGFSRGADACLRFANVMYEFYPQININIFAAEPVPGPGRHGAEAAKTIPPNVKHYVATLALHEDSTLFRPQDYSSLKPQDYETTKVECIPLPGHHGVHSRASENRPGTETASELVQDIAIERLKEWGTTFKVDPQYPIKLKTEGGISIFEPRTDTDPRGIIGKYSTMICDIKNYGEFSKVRYMARHREDYSPILPHCFINTHHLKLFAKTFPITYQYMMDPTEERKENSSTELNKHPRVQEWLDKTFEKHLKAHPEERQRNFFNIRKDRLDCNYLRVAMAVHALRKIPMISRDDKKASKKLLDDCKNILRKPFTDKEKEIEHKVEEFHKKYPDSKLSRVLQERFMAKEASLQERMCHELKAARNQSFLQRVLEGIKSVLSPRREEYYDAVKSSLTRAVLAISSPPERSKEQIVTALRDALKNINEKREAAGFSKESTTEKVLTRLIMHAIQSPISTQQSKTQEVQPAPEPPTKDH
jgi:hypothetical protein